MTIGAKTPMTEENKEKSEVYRFGDAVLDVGRRELRIAGDAVTTQPKAFDLLVYLIRHRDRAIDKDELQDAIWPRSVVTETALTRCVMKARRAVGDDADTQAIIRTVHGHGYRFVADLSALPASSQAAEPTAPATATTDTAPAHGATAEAVNRQPHWLLAATVTAIAVAALWWLLSPPVQSQTIRLAVLPIENATGEQDLDWVSTGFMALINRMLEDRDIEVVGERQVSRLAASHDAVEAGNNDAEFRQALQKTSGYTHLLETTLERDGDLYRVTYAITGEGQKPKQRTIVGQEPVDLVTQLVATAATLVTDGAPPVLRNQNISDDAFLKEAYARAMDMQMEGNYQGAQEMFQMIVAQDPTLFWPRYEYALTARNLRDYETAERLFIELRQESEQQQNLKRLAAVHNSLGIMYMNRRRNDEALAALQKTVELATTTNEFYYLGVAHQNLGLLAKNLGDIPLAHEHMLQSQAAFEQLDVDSLPGTLHNNMAGVLIQLGELAKAEQHSLAAIENFRLTGERLYESYALSRLASIYRRNGQLQEAETTATQAMAVREELGDRRGVAASKLGLADIARQRGDLTRSLQYAREAQDIGADIDEPGLTMDALLTAAKAELALHRSQDAIANFTAAEAIARNTDSRQNAFSARYGIARSWLQIGDVDTATAIADELLLDARSNNRRREETAGLFVHAQIHQHQEQWQAAAERYDAVLTIAADIGDTGMEASARAGLARCQLELGEVDAAIAEVDAILGLRPADAHVLRLQAQIAASQDRPADALTHMTAARTSAGEAWRPEDDARLQRYRDAAAATASRQ